VFRIAILIYAAFLSWPAQALQDEFARPLPGTLQEEAARSEASRAVEAALAEAEDAGDPLEKTVLEALAAFYGERDFQPLWFTEGEPSPQMSALRARMQDAASDGLDPSLYATADIAADYSGDLRSMAEAEIGFSRAVARFVTHLAAGAIRPKDISRIITLEPERPDIGLTALSQASDVTAAIAALEPPHPQYRALKAELAELRSREADPTEVVVPAGTLLKPGQRDPRVPALRQRLGQTLEVHSEPNLYDAALVAAVQAFQAENSLKPDGIVGPQTLFALNGVTREEDIAAIVANMERWRWMPRDLGAFHVMVNVPEFVLRVVKDDAVVHQTRVVVGKPSHPTPTFSHEMSYIVVNPFWNVPVSIVSNEMLPEIRQSPYGYFARRGYQVLVRSGGKMRVVDPWAIDWWSVNPRSVAIRQVPGDANALGRIKFMFPNQHSVYLHDTPSKKLFERDRRAFSHGCVRVDNPLEFADVILPVAAPEWNSGRLEALYGGRERRVNLDKPIPVHLAYFTRWVDETGTLRRFEDIYGYDEEMTALSGV
jgi:murein L,D-transpeptidase YcbB/YkuD